ncbi:Olfactory receptor 11 [Heterocephalus glaber]|uniref:Olfactory receptor 11 n=1 Tax=Heterocephalus glaber TaxID=10181 RepID=G5C2P5_HETGA|nr:Olfactory receptor 11 [Heterocephalus glaber]
MGRGNMSFPNIFVLLGFSEFPWPERPLFAVVLISYLLSLVGNSSILLLSLVDPRLQTPMYFFLDNLSLLDLCITCTTVPQLLANLWRPEKTITSWGCITQSYLFCLAASTECVLLAMMAIDRYVAICWPFQYTLIMHPWAITFATIPFGMVALLMMVISYTFIARAVLKLPSAEGRRKTLST